MPLIAFIDDRDPSVQYTGQWERIEDDDAFNGTLSIATSSGPSAAFSFSGSQIAVAGTLVANSSASFQVQFSIDDSTPQTYTAPHNATQNQESVTFFESEPLEDGQHTLIFNVTSATPDAPFALDGMDFYPSSTQTEAPDASFAVSSLGSVATSDVGANGASHSSNSAPVGAIVGGVVGGLAVLVIAASSFFYFCYRHRRSRPYYYASAKPEDLLHHEFKHAPAVTPYPLTTGTTTATPSEPPPAFTDDSSVYISGKAVSVTHGLDQVGSQEMLSTPPRSKQAEAGLSTTAPSVAYCQDSGMRFTSDGASASNSDVNSSEVVLNYVPPSYSEV